ncbi:MAG: GNAT family N-acetyltransferase, partial [Bacteroidota bacterium]|nr:GNAT family N-acetyltransferase [Bacteroidota bacterium]
HGGWRAQIEGVRVDRSMRGQGIGRRLIAYAIEWARGRRCEIVQLTTDLRRPDVIRFYENLGFKSSHQGMKLWL